MPEAGPPHGSFASFLYSVKVHLALDVKLFHLSLGTNNFIIKGGGGGLRKQFMSKLVGKNILFPSMSKQNKV